MGRKLFVEIGNAAHLMPDGEGAVYCVLDYDGQRHRTEVMKPREGWNSPIWFPVTDPHSMDAHVLDITVYSVSSSSSRSSYLGRVRIRGSSFSRESGGPLVYYKLRRKGFFSSVKGEIGLRVWWTGEPDPEPEAPPQTAPVTVTVPAAESSAREVPAEHAREVEAEPVPRPATPVIPPAARPATPPAARPSTPPAARPGTPPAARPVTPPVVTVVIPPAAPAVKLASPVPRHVAASTSAAGEVDDVCSCIYSCSSSCSCSSSSDSDHEHEEEDGEWSAYDCDEH